MARQMCPSDNDGLRNTQRWLEMFLVVIKSREQRSCSGVPHGKTRMALTMTPSSQACLHKAVAWWVNAQTCVIIILSEWATA